MNRNRHLVKKVLTDSGFSASCATGVINNLYTEYKPNIFKRLWRKIKLWLGL